MVVCHLGAGCSLTAVAAGRSIDTSMGFTPLEGVMMATRSGSIDPSIPLFLQTQGGLTVAEIDEGLNDRSGFLGVSGVSADLRAVLAAGSAQATLAYDMFIHSVVRMAGGLAAALGGLDALLFTGGIGEHSARVRRDVATALSFTGLTLDDPANDAAQGDALVAAPESRVAVLVVTAREDLAILGEMRRLLPAMVHS
jgi:acetate kinase